MIIKEIGFGNLEEAFIEDRLHDTVNIIFSDDNNKGKTLVIQGLMYSLGNEPIFPSGFLAEKYYFYSQIVINGDTVEFLRHRNSVAINFRETMYLFDTISEMKYFLKSENIIALPTIVKDGREVIADLSLFYEIFFVGQDKRNPSNIISYGYNKKQDFINMLCSLNGYPLIDIQEDAKEIEEEIKKVKSEINTTKKMLKLLKTDSKLSSYVDKFSDDLSFIELRDKMKITHQNIIIFRRNFIRC